MKDILAKAAQIKLVVFDVDGVLTDGSLFIGDDGQEYKAFHSRDGLGMKLLRKSGVEIGIITARTSEVVKHRMESLDPLAIGGRGRRISPVGLRETLSPVVEAFGHRPAQR